MWRTGNVIQCGTVWMHVDTIRLMRCIVEPASHVLCLIQIYVVLTSIFHIHVLIRSEETVVYYNERQEKDPKSFKDKDGNDLETIEKISLLEWLANNFKKFGCKLQFITNKSQEGSQFCRGFGGIGGLLRYQVDFLTMETEEDDDFL